MISLLDILTRVGLAHRRQNLALADKRIAAVRDEHVVEQQHVTHLPWKRDHLGLVRSAQLINRLVLDRRAVAVVTIERQTFFTKVRQEQPSQFRLKTRLMPKADVIEPNPLARLRVTRNRRT